MRKVQASRRSIVHWTVECQSDWIESLKVDILGQCNCDTRPTFDKACPAHLVV
jgi:hypothetical protein